MCDSVKPENQSSTKITFIKDVAMRNGRLMKLAHCVEEEIDPKTGCEVKGGVFDKWLPVEEIPETSE